MAMLGYGTVGSGAAELLGSNKYSAKNAGDLDMGMQYEDALKAAQELGFAEADQSGDVLGLDWARKLSILSPKAFRNAKDMACIDSDDFRFAKRRGCTIRLLAVNRMADCSVYASAVPVMVPYEYNAAGDLNNLWESEGSWLLRVRSGNRVEVMKKLAQAFSICSIMAGEFGAEGDEVAAFVKAKKGSQIDICMDDLKNSLELKGFKKIMLLS